MLNGVIELLIIGVMFETHNVGINRDTSLFTLFVVLYFWNYCIFIKWKDEIIEAFIEFKTFRVLFKTNKVPILDSHYDNFIEDTMK